MWQVFNPDLSFSYKFGAVGAGLLRVMPRVMPEVMLRVMPGVMLGVGPGVMPVGGVEAPGGSGRWELTENKDSSLVFPSLPPALPSGPQQPCSPVGSRFLQAALLS